MNQNLPKTVDGAVSMIIARLDESTKNKLRTIAKDSIEMFEMSDEIKDLFSRENGKEALLESTGKCNPDKAAMVITKAVWEKINYAGKEQVKPTTKPIDIEVTVNNDPWKKQVHRIEFGGSGPEDTILCIYELHATHLAEPRIEKRPLNRKDVEAFIHDLENTRINICPDFSRPAPQIDGGGTEITIKIKRGLNSVIFMGYPGLPEPWDNLDKILRFLHAY